MQSTAPFDLAVELAKSSSENQLDGTVVDSRFWEIGTPEALTQFQNKFGKS